MKCPLNWPLLRRLSLAREKNNDMRRLASLFLIAFAIPTQAQTPELLSGDVDAQVEVLSKQADFTGSIGIDTPVNMTRWGFVRPKAGKTDIGHAGNIWRWASVTKQVIAVLVLQEVAKGNIALDQPLSKYLPGFASANANKITVRQLLRHQSGLPNPDDVQASSEAMSAYYLPAYKGNRDPLTGYCAGTPKAEPGGKWAYNNCDYIVAGALLEVVTGKKWPVLVRERIAKPLRLLTVGAYPTKNVTHTGIIDGKPETKIDLAAFAASGGLYGSLEDLLRFDRALLSGKLLAKKELDQMWDGQADLGYIALGQWVFEASLKDCAKPVRLVERRGAIGGVQIRNFILPERNMSVAIFTDKADFEFGEIWQGKGFSHDILNLSACTKVN